MGAPGNHRCLVALVRSLQGGPAPTAASLPAAAAACCGLAPMIVGERAATMSASGSTDLSGSATSSTSHCTPETEQPAAPSPAHHRLFPMTWSAVPTAPSHAPHLAAAHLSSVDGWLQPHGHDRTRASPQGSMLGTSRLQLVRSLMHRRQSSGLFASPSHPTTYNNNATPICRGMATGGQLSRVRVPKSVGFNDVTMPNTTGLKYGSFGIRALTGKRVAANTIEAVRRTLRRKLQRDAKLYIRIAATIPVTRKPEGIRMGKGKGNIAFYATPVRPGQILFEIDRVPRVTAMAALNAIRGKFPCKLAFVEYS